MQVDPSQMCWSDLKIAGGDHEKLTQACNDEFMAVYNICEPIGWNTDKCGELGEKYCLNAPRNCQDGLVIKKLNVQTLVTDYCWNSFEAALAAMDETKYDESCDDQWDPLEERCD